MTPVIYSSQKSPEGCSETNIFLEEEHNFGKSVQICAQITNCTSKKYIHEEVHFLGRSALLCEYNFFDVQFEI